MKRQKGTVTEIKDRLELKKIQSVERSTKERPKKEK